MAQNREKLTKRQKGYIKLIVANIVFFGVFVLLYIWEQTIPGLQFSAVGTFSLILLLPFMIWYGAYSYRIMQKVILPNLLPWIFIFVYWFWMSSYNLDSFHAEIFFDNILSDSLGMIFFSGIYIAIAVISSVVTKLISRAWRKRSAEMEERLSALQAQEEAELEQAISENSKEE